MNVIVPTAGRAVPRESFVITCPVCHRPVEGAAMVCPTCNIALVPAPAAQFSGAPASSVSPPPPGVYPQSPPYLAGATMPSGPPVAEPVRPEWDRPRDPRNAEPPTSPVVVILAVVLGVLMVGAVGWFTLGPSGDGDIAASGPDTTLTPVAADPNPIAGQTRPTGDGWVTYRTPDGSLLIDLPVVPASPQPLPSNPTVLVVYGVTDGGRVGFGWSSGQLAPGTDEAAVLVELMKGIALSRGAVGIEPTVLPAPTGPVVTATLQLTGGKALFVLRSVDRRPVLAMVVAGLGEPDPVTATRMLDSFRPAS